MSECRRQVGSERFGSSRHTCETRRPGEAAVGDARGRSTLETLYTPVTRPVRSSSSAHPPTSATSANTADSRLLRASRGEQLDRPPVWFMRQAGRSLPEYRRLREGVPMLESCTQPDMVVEITLQPVRRYEVDAAIFYSDIVVPLRAIGVDVDISPGVGPVVDTPFRSRADLDRLRPLEPADVE